MSSLELVECDVPEPGPGQLLIRVHAASLNFRDHAIVTGNSFNGVLKRDTVPLSDGAGEVAAVGPGVTRFSVGDRVIDNFFQGWIDGLPNPATTNALGSPADGMLSVLVLGTGGVSIFALQFARMSGARVIVTSSNDAKLARATELGAAHTINHRANPDWEQEVLRLTGGRGVDHVIEVGGAGTLARSFACVGFRGQVSLIGVLAGREGDTNPHALMLRNARLVGIFVGSRVMFEQMNEAIAINGMRPVVDRVFPFADAAKAYAWQLAGEHFGKVVIAIQ